METRVSLKYFVNSCSYTKCIRIQYSHLKKAIYNFLDISKEFEIRDALRNLIPFLHFKKREKYSWKSFAKSNAHP